jgi:prolyl-tRNA synthetase
MLWSKLFIPTLKEIPQGAESIAHQLMLRAGFLRMLIAGVYSYLPCGLRVLNNVQKIIRQEMNAIGAQEALLSCLQPQELWDRSGRNTEMEEVMIRFVDRRGRRMCLGPTHEEVITELVADQVTSYKQLPLVLYQIQTKFRDEIRPRFGLLRSCEFIMKDAYSFDANQDGLDNNYKLMYQAYLKIFNRLGLLPVITEADSGVMGGSVSHEFLILSESGEDTVYLCGKCNYATGKNLQNCPGCENPLYEKKAIEIGHIFKLGTKYSNSLSAFFTDDKGGRAPIIMGCYGIGVSRAIAAIIEANHDAGGIIWPKEVAPFDLLLLPLNIADLDSRQLAFGLYHQLNQAGLNVLLDDRDERSGVKFNDADLIGIPLRVVIGAKSLKENSVELQRRIDKVSCYVNIAGAADRIMREAK